ncbi:MAG: FtsB family cell division protein [Candidatus Muiribacteriota bacterium]
MKKIVYLDSEERKKRLNKIVLKVSNKMIIIVFFFIAFTIFTAFRVNHARISNLRVVAHEKQLQVNKLQKKMDKLEDKIEALNTLDGIEKEARLKLNYVKEGETVFRPVNTKK